MKIIKLGLIGCGNMGGALVAALLRQRVFAPSEIGVADSRPESCQSLGEKHGIHPFSSNRELASTASTLLLAVKPQQMKEVLTEIRSEIGRNHLVLTIAAGLDANFYNRFLPAETRLVRVMPNTPALLGEGATALFATPAATQADKDLALKIFSAVGLALFVPREDWMDIVTALSGSGPAFVYLFIQSLIRGGVAQGLPEETARALTLQTITGATEMVRKSKGSIGNLIDQVNSKGGTTEAGLKVLRAGGFSQLIGGVIAAACRRAKELRS